MAWSFATESCAKKAAAFTKPDGAPAYRAAFSDAFYDDIVIGVERMRSVGAIISSPLVDGDAVYVGSWDGQLYAIG